MISYYKNGKNGIGLRSALVLFSLACAITAGLATSAAAANLSLYSEFVFGSSDLKFTSPAGEVTKSHSDSFTQRHNLSLSADLSQTLLLSAGGIFQDTVQNSSFAATTNSSETTAISPFVSLLLQNSVFPGGISYHKRVEKSVSNGIASPSSIQETYDAHFEWKPADLPPVSLTYARGHSYDENRLTRDITTESLTWATNYRPVKKIDLSYQGTLSNSSNKLNGVDSEFLTNNGRIGYSDQFLERRGRVAVSYSLSTTTSTVSSRGSGNVFIPVQPLNGALFGVTSPSLVPVFTVTNTPGGLTPNPSLLSGASIPLTVAAPVPNGQQINLGFDFATPVSINVIYLKMVSGPNQRPDNISRIAGHFQWEVYTSADGVLWELRQTIATPQFGSDPSGRSDSVGFILNLSIPASRFVKAVVIPVQATDLLSAGVLDGVNINDIAVNLMQAFSQRPANSFAGGSQGTVTGQLGVFTGIRLLNNPDLNYDLAFGVTHSSGDLQPLLMSYYLTNSLGANHTFSPLVSGSARVSLQQTKSTTTPLNSNLGWSAGVTLTPLPTLSHSINYSGSIQNLGDPNSTLSNSIYLGTNAQLYPGVSLGISGGYASSGLAGGQTSDSLVFTGGLSLAPRRDLTMVFSYSEQATKLSGGTRPVQTSSSRTGSVNASYAPFEALYFSGTWSIVSESGQPSRTEQNYGLNWSPFRGGTLQFSLSYNESLQLPSNDKSAFLSPTISWKIRPGMNLDLSYQDFSQSGPAGKTVGTNLAATLRIAL